MTDEELEEMKAEYPGAWWNLDYNEYQFSEEDFNKAWNEDFGVFFSFCMDYEPDGWCEWVEGREDYHPEESDIYGYLMVNALYEEKWNIVEALNCGDEISRDAIMTCLFSRDKRKQMQWLLDHRAHRRDDALWETWKNLCFEWDNDGEPEDEEEEEEDEEEEIDENYWYDRCEYWRGQWKTLNEENKRLKAILDENGISY